MEVEVGVGGDRCAPSNEHICRNPGWPDSCLLPIELLEEACSVLLGLHTVQVLEEDDAAVADIADVDVVVAPVVVDFDAGILLVVLLESGFLGDVSACTIV